MALSIHSGLGTSLLFVEHLRYEFDDLPDAQFDEFLSRSLLREGKILMWFLSGTNDGFRCHASTGSQEGRELSSSLTSFPAYGIGPPLCLGLGRLACP